MRIKNTRIFLAIVAFFSALWCLYPRLLVGGLIPVGESYDIGRLIYLSAHSGEPYTFKFLQYLEFYIIYFLSKLTSIDVMQMSYYINPVIMGLCVFAFYYYVSKYLDKKQSRIATLLFAFSESLFYKAATFSSTEVLSLLFIFVFLGLYEEKRYLPSLFMLFLAFMTHLLPFFVGIGVLMVPWILKRSTWKRFIIVSISGIAIFLFIMTFMSILRNWVYLTITGLSISNLFLYSPIEVIFYAQYYLGSVILIIIALYSYRKWNSQIAIWIFVTVIVFFLSYVAYSNYVIGPTRIIPYITIGLIFAAGKFTISTKLVALVLCLSIISPLIGGSNAILWLGDSLTKNEIKAIDWSESQHLFIKTGDYLRSPVNYWRVDTPQLDYINMFYNTTVLLQVSPKYIIISPRMEKQEFFLIIPPLGGRTQMLRDQLIDIWKNDPAWRVIYNQTGVRIYEKVNYEP